MSGFLLGPVAGEPAMGAKPPAGPRQAWEAAGRYHVIVCFTFPGGNRMGAERLVLAVSRPSALERTDGKKQTLVGWRCGQAAYCR
jgi:hypothetical protein